MDNIQIIENFNKTGEEAKSSIKGFVRIYEKETGKVLFNRHNDIHYENMSIALAQSLANKKGWIKEIVFGNGGVKLNAANEYIYTAPQTIGKSATLHNQTYSKVVDDNNLDEDTDPTRNFMQVQHVTGNYYTDILIRATLEKNEPSDQNLFNNDTQVISEYTFSEAGLKTYQGDLITHLVFQPIVKAANITLVMDYLLRIQIV
jgi:hypothetical protein